MNQATVETASGQRCCDGLNLSTWAYKWKRIPVQAACLIATEAASVMC